MNDHTAYLDKWHKNIHTAWKIEEVHMSDPVAKYLSLWEKFRSFGLEERVLTMSLGDDVPDNLREVAQIRRDMNTLLHGMSRMEITQIAAYILEAHNASS